MMSASRWMFTTITLSVDNAQHDPAVQQALSIVQMKRLIPFEPHYFKATEALMEKHRQLKTQHSGGA